MILKVDLLLFFDLLHKYLFFLNNLHSYVVIVLITVFCHDNCSFFFDFMNLQDYHRFHVPITGVIGKNVPIPGNLYTV